jgi:hypothetical protein
MIGKLRDTFGPLRKKTRSKLPTVPCLRLVARDDHLQVVPQRAATLRVAKITTAERRGTLLAS